MPLLTFGLLFASPAAVIWLVRHQAWAARLGVVVICYLAGLLVSTLNLFDQNQVEAASTVGWLSIGLALPLLLMALDLRSWRSLAGKAMLSMFLATSAVVAVATSLYFLFADGVSARHSHLAAMSVGVYTGGTPNLAAIKAGLDIADSDYLLFHSVDTVIGAAYLLLMLTVGVPLFRRLLPGRAQMQAEGTVDSRLEEDFSLLLQRQTIWQVPVALAVAASGAGAVYALASWLAATFTALPMTPLLIVLLTTAGVALSFTALRQKLTHAYRIGMYLIYVFCFSIAATTTLETLAGADPMIGLFVLGAVLGSVVVHAVLCRFVGVDADTFMVTSVAAVCSPPFVPLIARALGNPGLLMSGMMTGIVGYALGNYLGISLALVLSGI
ncbi:hypothetical protein A3709_15400 [Halioglobus sp. HI00S01]|uniref:DUF819 family protein n=1 Tax=Halioglobus sp. HI00S01 TaxID=1822214 RepID=UPI0007C37A10|nr:DUF819 family protein [Halioglobus sp. HI00S01]KZX58948.1 hypothetical protein A3709_15400 [Halioglobus sp. HI00S01]